MKTTKLFFLCMLAATLFCAQGWADTIEFKDGSVLKGKVILLEPGHVIFETTHMGRPTIDLDGVTSISTEKPITIILDDGTKLEGTSIRKNGKKISVSGGDVKTDFDVERLGRKPELSAGGTLEFGISGQSGNEEKFGGHAKLSGKTARERWRREGYLAARFAQESGERSENGIRGFGRVEKSLRKKTFWYGALDLEHDEFKSLSLRTVATSGFGRIWRESATRVWKSALGIGITDEQLFGGASETFPIAEITNEYDRRINSKLAFLDRTAVLIDLDEIDGVRAENDAALSVDLTEEGDWKLKLGLNHQYNNRPADGVDRLDTYYYLSAVKKF